MSFNSPLSAIEQEQITSQEEGMGFELENPEIAELVDQYKQGCIAYGDAKDRVVLRLAENVTKFADFSDISDEQYNEFCQKAKELLLGKDENK